MESSQNISLDGLEAISDELLQLYRRLCWGISVTPSKTMLEHIKETHISETGFDPESGEAVSVENISIIKILLKEETNENGTDFLAVKEDLIDIIGDQLRHLRKAIDTATGLCRKNNRTGLQGNSSLTEADCTGGLSTEDMLTIKNEQIATLRQVLKATKQTAEMDMANLKSKYENEKAIVSETMMKLRNELSSLKESKESVISWRTQFSERCIRLITQLSDLQMILASSEEDITQLNALVSKRSSTAAGLPDSGQELGESE